jgi:hypothetical protein
MSQQLPEIRKSAKAAQDSATAAQLAITQSRDQFRDEQRPYIALSNNGLGEPRFIENLLDPTIGQVLWTSHVANFGKTPAYHVLERRYIKLGNGRFVPSHMEKGTKLAESFMAPTADTFNTAVSETMPKTDYPPLLEMHEGISVKKVITYRDSYGTPYETDICLTRLNSGAIAFCKGNNIK